MAGVIIPGIHLYKPINNADNVCTFVEAVISFRAWHALKPTRALELVGRPGRRVQGNSHSGNQIPASPPVPWMSAAFGGAALISVFSRGHFSEPPGYRLFLVSHAAVWGVSDPFGSFPGYSGGPTCLLKPWHRREPQSFGAVGLGVCQQERTKVQESRVELALPPSRTHSTQ